MKEGQNPRRAWLGKYALQRLNSPIKMRHIELSLAGLLKVTELHSLLQHDRSLFIANLQADER